jgi:hypothetical protein
MLDTVYWKIWYDDHSTFSHEEGPPEEAPTDGILAILEKRRNRTIQIHHGQDYYYWTGENWASGSLAALEKWLRRELPLLKFGRWTKDSIFRAVLEEAKKCP